MEWLHNARPDGSTATPSPGPHPTLSEDEELLRYLTAQAASFDLPPDQQVDALAPPLAFAPDAYAPSNVDWGLGGQAYFGGDIWSGAIGDEAPFTEEYSPTLPALSLAGPSASYAAPPFPYALSPSLRPTFYTAPPPPSLISPYAFLKQAPTAGAFDHHQAGDDPFAGLYLDDNQSPISPSTLLPDPTRPASPSFVALASLGSSNRIVAAALPPPLVAKPGRKAPGAGLRSKGKAPLEGKEGGKGGSAVLQLNGRCWTCGDAIAKLVLRKPAGQGSLEDLGPRAVLTCPACLSGTGPEREEEAGTTLDGLRLGLGTAPELPAKKEPTYLDTFSAAIDRLEGLHITPDELSPRALETVLEMPEATSDPLVCDVCDHTVGSGKVTGALEVGAPSFTVEIICEHCFALYKPCSDCGSGGGRLTPGKWRSKELFPDGRRTCRLLHTRNPPLSDITYAVFNIRELKEAEIPLLEARCRQLYFQARLAEFARPESLEHQQELGRTFAEIEQMTSDSWNLLSPQFRVDVEEARGVRRYLALQLAPPHDRRSKDKASHKEAPLTVVGFFMTELEFSTGALFLCCAAPWSTTGQGFKVNTILSEHMFARCRSDLAALNTQRLAQLLPAYPPLLYIWTVASFRRSSRLACSLLKRGFVYLPDLVEKRPETRREAFPPEREIWLPRPVVHAWEILVKYIGDDDGVV